MPIPTPSPLQAMPSRQHPVVPTERLAPAANAARFASLPHPDTSEPLELAAVAIRGYN